MQQNLGTAAELWLHVKFICSFHGSSFLLADSKMFVDVSFLKRQF